MKAPESVLVLRFSAVGDVVLTAPALEALRLAWPGTRILVAYDHGCAAARQEFGIHLLIPPRIRIRHQDTGRTEQR